VVGGDGGVTPSPPPAVPGVGAPADGRREVREDGGSGQGVPGEDGSPAPEVPDPQVLVDHQLREDPALPQCWRGVQHHMPPHDGLAIMGGNVALVPPSPAPRTVTPTQAHAPAVPP